jgi:hypothetical protein
MTNLADEPHTSQPVEERVAEGLRLIGYPDGIKLPDMPREFLKPESVRTGTLTRTSIGDSSR